MNKEAQDFTSVSSCHIYSQGAMANHTGSMNERSLNESLRGRGLTPKKRRYESSWSSKSEVDCDLIEHDDLGVVAEYKNQNVSGTADQKGGTELFNAGQTIECDDYVIVFSGSHWETERGSKLFNMYKDMAAKMNKHAETFCIAAKRLHVMKKYEFIEFVEQRKKERQQL
tara:strand:- start:221 stop:730 length:510 start_codon:yes stop_codon:yes gene_type:complete